LKNPAEYARILRKKKRQQEKNESKTQNKGMKKRKRNRSIPFILSINSVIFNGNVDRSMHRQKHTGIRR
jgi:hypothetical protein